MGQCPDIGHARASLAARATITTTTIAADCVSTGSIWSALGFDAFGEGVALFADTSPDMVMHFCFGTSITLVNVDAGALLMQAEVFVLV